MTDRIRIGIVGVGYAGTIHLKNLLEDKRVVVHGIYDIARRKMNSIASRYNLERYDSYEAMTRDQELDVIYICTPNVFHAKQTLAALQNSKHAFCEKPMALKLSDAKKIVQATRKTGLKYQIGFNRRFCPAYAYVKKLIDSGKIRPVSLNVKLVRNGLEKPRWVRDTSVSGGLLFESIVHALDLSRWFLGEITQVSCHAKSLVYNQLDTFAIALHSRKGKISNIFSNAYAHNTTPFERVEMFDDEAEIVVEEFSRVRYKHNKLTIKDFTRLSERQRWGFAIEDRYFIDSLVNDRNTMVDEHESLQSMILLDGCHRSIIGKKPVKLGFS
ncbi:MAG: myo-inositol 2-dehydrogenase/D-chiro-inositol 1-dehydrogenase [Candidatus Nitrosomirales archaeon]|jgi:myo-inositol 2-dehydrogenase/D-chiro-inositol 1-dehydrogenase